MLVELLNAIAADMNISRRGFINGSAALAGTVGSGCLLTSCTGRERKYPWIETDMSIDSYVTENIEDMINPSQDTLDILRRNKENINAYSEKYDISPDLLAAIIAREHERPWLDQMFDRIQDFFKIRDSDEHDLSVGIARMKISLAAYLRGDIDDVREYRILDKQARMKLNADIRSMLASEDAAVGYAADWISKLRDKCVLANQIEHFDWNNPVHARLVIQGYISSEDALTWIKPRDAKQEAVIAKAEYALTLLREYSPITMMFDRSVLVWDTDRYKAVSGQICHGFDTYGKSRVRASGHFREASDLALYSARRSGDDLSKTEYYKLALYSLAYASKAIRESGAENVGFRENGKSIWHNAKKLVSDDLRLYGEIWKESGLKGGETVNHLVCNGMVSNEVPEYSAHKKKVEDWLRLR